MSRKRKTLPPEARHLDLIAAGVSLEPPVEAAEGDEAPAVARIDAYGGGLMTVAGFGPLVIDVEGMEAPERVTLLAGHENRISAVLGSGIPRRQDGRLAVEGALSRSSDLAARVIELHREGVQLQASVGVEIIEAERVAKGKQIVSNGRTIRAEGSSFLHIRRSRLRHIAILPNGADGTTSVNIAAEAAFASKETDMEFTEWAEAQGFTVDDLDEKQAASLKTIFAAANTNTPAATATIEAQATEAIAQLRKELAGESARVGKIRSLCAGQFPEIEAQAITDGWDEVRCELEVLRAKRPRTPAIHSQGGEVNASLIEAALCLQAGVNVENRFNDETLSKAEKFRNRGLRWAAERIAEASGRSLDADPGSVEWIRAAFSTSELSGIVGNVANKALQAAFEAADSVADRIAATRSHANFHAHTVYSMALGGELKPVAPDGELKHLTLSEESRTRQLGTRGALLSVTRQDIINDDLGAFTQNAQAMARKAITTREKALFTPINATAAGASFFTTARANYFEGAGSVLASAGLGTAVQKFMDQTGPDGDPIGIMPKILLVPTALYTTAKELMLSEKVVGPSSSKTPDANIWRGAYEVVTSPWLGNTALTGASSTAWYLLAEPGDVATFEIAYLNGQTMPTVEFFGVDADPNVLGVTWRVFWDFGVALGEYRAGVKSKGAA